IDSVDRFNALMRAIHVSQHTFSHSGLFKLAETLLFSAGFFFWIKKTSLIPFHKPLLCGLASLETQHLSDPLFEMDPRGSPERAGFRPSLAPVLKHSQAYKKKNQELVLDHSA
ncbi:hypothetical protein PVN27_22730, partial [Bacillus paralicheniformis]|uniref:hypothetical protein n=1 Tax=Bacillus paralicheniformis TaxID=1648923 RepID=UPI00237D1DE5